ncbi:TPR repeat-containing thioredoxin TTL4 [Apostasia shenzhenica]|uniref:TPR repeat-containing thioredoxin TTL4 n=1 Tax=Apostasia shenzhenica TaxID=1088818 RepID=A0A2I0B702_9ASPA|nr:TPR repeat-containing thioredoxin TTL4 [Apostasia shenzhenica]
MGKSAGRKKKSANSGAPASPVVRAGQHSTAFATPLAASPSLNGVLDPALFLKRAHELKEEGNRRFQSKDFPGALEQYDLALKLTPHGHVDRAVFHSNRAACLLQIRPVDHEAVVGECSLALQAQPLYPRALLRRARAFEALRRYDLALQDVNSLLAVDPSNSDALDLARRLRAAPSPSVAHHHDQSNASRPSPAALGASAVRVAAPITGLGPYLPTRPAPKKPSSPPQLQQSSVSEKEKPSVSVPPANGVRARSDSFPPSPFKPTTISDSTKKPSFSATTSKRRPLKLVYDHDIRLAEMPDKCSFKTLREIVAKRFPSSKSVLIKYKDCDGDLVTVTSTNELRLAESCIDELGGKETKEGNGVAKEDKLKVLRLHVVEVSPEQEPSVPDEEGKCEEEDELLAKDDESSLQSLAENSLAEVIDVNAVNISSEEQIVKEDLKKDCNHVECKEVEIDDWIYEFAQLFRQQVGIDPDAHLDLHELGMELCSEALEETVSSEEAQTLFEMAATKFQEVAALAFFNWGNVHMCAARKRIPLDESLTKEAMAARLQEAYNWVTEKYALAGKKYEDALQIKPDFYEGLLALGQQHFETAKLQWSFALANKVDLTSWDYSETIKLFDNAGEKMKAATEMWEKFEVQRIRELKDPSLNKKEEMLKKKKKHGSLDGQGELSVDEAIEQTSVMRSQIHLFWGNMLFERSQVEFKLGFGGWKKNLDEAVERFKLAGASEVDICTVLKNHSSNGSSVGAKEKKIPRSSDNSKINMKEEDMNVLTS